MAQLERPLGRTERYMLARAFAGVPPLVAITARLETCDGDSVRAAVDCLLAQHPLLACFVAEARTTAPRWAKIVGLTAEDVVDESADNGMGGPEDVLSRAFDAGAELAAGRKALWRVWLGPKDDEGGRRITMLLNHILADGTATRNLFAELLRLVRDRSTPVNDVAAFPPTREDSIPIKPSLLTIAKVVFWDLVAPKLPAFLRPSPPTTVFPNPPLVPPYLQSTAFRSLSLPASLVADLKAQAKSHGVNTLHPIIFAAGLASASVLAPGGTVVGGDSPISVRSADYGHPSCTGNYIIDITTIYDSSLASSSVWSTCRTYAERLVDPSVRRAAHEHIGMLAYIPDGLVAPSADAPEGKTKFDVWLEETLRKEHPYGATFEVSNLGVLPETGWEAEGLTDVWWAQTAMARGAAFAINVRIASSRCQANTRLTFRFAAHHRSRQQPQLHAHLPTRCRRRDDGRCILGGIRAGFAGGSGRTSIGRSDSRRTCEAVDLVVYGTSSDADRSRLCTTTPSDRLDHAVHVRSPAVHRDEVERASKVTSVYPRKRQPVQQKVSDGKSEREREPARRDVPEPKSRQRSNIRRQSRLGTLRSSTNAT